MTKKELMDRFGTAFEKALVIGRGLITDQMVDDFWAFTPEEDRKHKTKEDVWVFLQTQLAHGITPAEADVVVVVKDQPTKPKKTQGEPLFVSKGNSRIN